MTAGPVVGSNDLLVLETNFSVVGLCNLGVLVLDGSPVVPGVVVELGSLLLVPGVAMDVDSPIDV